MVVAGKIHCGDSIVCSAHLQVPDLHFRGLVLQGFLQCLLVLQEFLPEGPVSRG